MVKRSVMALAVAFAMPQWALAQQVAGDAATLKVAVTGSNIKRVAGEGASPVTIITAKEIKATGANNVTELLHFIPAFGSGATIDAVDNPFSRGTSTASLRGLGPASTLVLLNGRRITHSAYADPLPGRSVVYDLNTLPLSSIDRIEILKNSGSAVYGSDAIAGVVNFITRDNYQGAEVTGNYSANDDNRFENKRASVTWGFGNLASDGYNIWVNLDVAQRESTLIKDVRDVKVAQLADVNYRLNELSSSLSDQPFFYRERTPGARNFANSFALRADVINRTNCDRSDLIVGSLARHNLTATDTLVGRTFCNFNADDFSEAQGFGRDTNLLSKGTFKLGKAVTAFTELAYNRSEREYIGAPRPVRSTTSTTTFSIGAAPTQFQIILPVGHPDNPFTAANGFTPSRAAIGYRFVNAKGGSANLNEGFRVLAGLRGTTGSWDWESAVLWHRSERHETVYGLPYLPTLEKIYTQNRSLAETAVDPTAARDIFNTGAAQIAQWDGRASTNLGQLAGGAATIAFGAEYRQEKLSVVPDQASARGDIVGLANQYVEGRRNVKSGFVELHTPFTQTLEMNFAARYDKYPSYKGSTVPKVSLKWAPSARFGVRASYSEGFRAPALNQVSPGGIQSFTTVADPLRCPDGVTPVRGADRTDCARGISSLTTGNPALEAEKSKDYNFGLFFSPSNNWDAVVDYFRIEKRGETGVPFAQFILDHPDQFTGVVLRDNNPASLLLDANGRPIPNSGPLQAVNRIFTNQSSTEVRGIDVTLNHRKTMGEHGKLATRLDLSYLLSYKRAESPGDARLNVAGSAGRIADWATNADDQPRVRARLTSTWTRGTHALTGSVNYVDSVSLLRRAENRNVYPVPYCQFGVGQPATAYALGGLPRYSNWQSDCKVGSWTTYGVEYAYTGIKNTTLSLNIQNLFDTAAPYDPRFAVGGYNTQLHNGFGRYIQVGAKYKFY